MARFTLFSHERPRQNLALATAPLVSLPCCRLAYSGFLAPMQLFQGYFAANCSFSRIRGCLRPSSQS